LYNGINSADDGFESAVNFFTDFPNDNSGNPFYWPYSIVYYLLTAGDCIDIVGIDHYPGTWSMESYNSWYQLDMLFNITDYYGKKAAVMEAGYATGPWWWRFPDGLHTQDKQKHFINTAIPTIRILTKLYTKDLVFVGWYELTDEENPSIPWLLPEKYFGILRADLSPKLGYNDLKQQFSKW